ncbi:hypothetical protein OG875_04650 [Streptomyces sp. NBC_01498]|uniref:hypothetical protein n=1 Tax=Streptomyces sp. NBC_01498 TaxID=2975870 RepID=UPI002E7BCC30|nr:hypothetical protein [Streptomyces sp. NBC_01498]WTL23945.1 hypothetical protein OG875_04650 [Streptomyces sp. NBC_01498]
MRCLLLRRARKHLGRRGVFLMIVGVGQVCWGSGMITDPPSTAGLQILTDRCPLSTWAWLWIGAGAVACASGFLRVGRDWAGFLTAYAPPTMWAFAYTAAAVGGDYSRGGFVAVWYLTIVGIIMWASGVPEYSVPPAPRRPRKGTAP